MIIALTQLNFKKEEEEIEESTLFLNTDKIISFKRSVKWYKYEEPEVVYTCIMCEDNKIFEVAEYGEDIMEIINKAEAGK